MYFNTDLPFHLLFEAWNVDTVGKLVGACVGIFLLALVYEGTKGIRDRLLVSKLTSSSLVRYAGSAADADAVNASSSTPGYGLHQGDHVVPLSQGTMSGV
ncbi:unnamed protein product [Hydatigera taeniaeformis]|uniref:Copper transport protein n=1 Tax=Hydatigena taeniaeformis TaxID=6205 RepID=A0A0R3WTY9_HYDTA|nr:unnamed protein product [Hydatigera taeniaeformis]